MAPSLTTFPPQCKGQSGRHQALEHIEDVVALWGLQRTSNSIAENVGQIILDNYPDQVMTANIWDKGDTKINCVSQWILKVFPHPYADEIDSISELWHPSEQDPSSICHIRNLEGYQVAIPHP